MSVTDVTDAWGVAWRWLTALDPGTLFYWAVPVALVVFLIVAKRSGKPARRLTALGTILGLGWSAQGMLDVAIHKYDVVPQIAAVIFIVFECFLVARMWDANDLRHDRVRRRRPVAFVWGLAVMMGVVVAFGEGWAQAPLRLSVPLLVAASWYVDLTKDDDPDDKPKTSLRWTPRRLAIAIGALEYTKADATQVDRDHLRDRLTSLHFRQRYGSGWLSKALRRDLRMAKLATLADETDLAEVASRMARADRVFKLGKVTIEPQPETHPTPVPQPADPVVVPAPEPTPGKEPPKPARGGVTTLKVDGEFFVGPDAEAHVIRTWLDAAQRGHRMTTAEVIEHYGTDESGRPRLGKRTADGWLSKARQQHIAGHNGNVPDLTSVP